ncbi:MAG: pilin [bacterium]
MNKKVNNLLYSLLVGIFVFLPVAALATGPIVAVTGTCGGAQCVIDLLQTIITWVLAIAGSLAVLMLIYGGIRYILSTGDEKRLEGAKKTILYAIIGIIVITASYLLVGVAGSLLGSVA